MKLILAENDGTLVGSLTVTRAEWQQALDTPANAQALLRGLRPAEQPAEPTPWR